MTTEEHREPLSSEVKRLEGEVGPHAHHPLLHVPVFEQLKQRNVFRVAVLYVVVCWLILDPVHVIFHMAGVPEWVNRLVLIVMAVGFPLVVIFAWVYEITPEGLKPTVEVPHGESIRKLTGRRLDRAIIAVLAVALAYFVIDKFWIAKHVATPQPLSTAQETAAVAKAAPATATAFTPPPHSIAVLPFVNISGDKDQEYFSDGLSEELLNALSRVNELQVAARTSSFYFKGKDVDLGTVARKLNVAAVLEGSVRKSARTVRVTAQLVDSVTGFHLWSQTYDRNLREVLALQTEIADAVTSALKSTLLGGAAAKVELGATRNPLAFDAYLRGLQLTRVVTTGPDAHLPIDIYTEAIRLDPNYALAFAARSIALSKYLGGYGQVTDPRGLFAKARADAERAIALAPTLSEAHVALASLLQTTLNFTAAGDEYERALALAPGNATAVNEYALHAAYMGRSEAALAAAQRGVALDPLNVLSHRALGDALQSARRYNESIAAYTDAIAVDMAPAQPYSRRGVSYYLLGNLQMAQSSCQMKPDYWESWVCLAVTLDKLGRQGDAEAMLPVLVQFGGDTFAYQFAEIYAQWGNQGKALEWLDTAMRLRDAGLLFLRTDPLMDPLRKEPRFQAIERELKFPD
jgi:serine/threonine-protein kinase